MANVDGRGAAYQAGVSTDAREPSGVDERAERIAAAERAVEKAKAQLEGARDALRKAKENR